MGLDTVEILMEIEDEFGISVPDDAASEMLTVGDTYRDIIDRLVAKGIERSAQMEADVWQRLVSIVTKQMGIKAEHVRQESRWIPDITPSG